MADTLKGRKFYIATTSPGGATPDPQASDLADSTAYDALDWTQVKGIGSLGETGSKDNIVSYDELDTDVLPKGKGITDAGSPMIEAAQNRSDPGQQAMNAAALTKKYYAFKIVDDDSGGTNGTTYYHRGLISGPVRPNGRNESFNIVQWTLGLVQREIVKNAS